LRPGAGNRRGREEGGGERRVGGGYAEHKGELRMGEGERNVGGGCS
jgi:hypothetical protein